MSTPTETKTKQTYTLAVEYESADGSYKTATVEKDFTPPDELTSITVKTFGADGTPDKEAERKFKRPVVQDQGQLLTLLDKNPWLVIAATNYGLDLFSRNVIKGPITTEIEGPGKAIAKLADQIFASRAKLGKPITKERALELARLTSEE